MNQNFNAYSSYYDLIYKDKDYVGESEYILNLLKTYGNEVKNIVEFGSGTGKHAMLFCQNGFYVEGVEPSQEMLNIASNNTHPNLSFKLNTIASYKSDNRYDAALSLFHVISYLNTNQELKEAFDNVNKHLKDGGLFVFDVWYTPAVLSLVPEKRTKTIENNLIEVVRHANPINHWNKNIIDVNYDIEINEKQSNLKHYIKETHPMRHFSIPEIEMLAQITGFKILHAEEFGTSKMPGPQTWGVCFILKKL